MSAAVKWREVKDTMHAAVAGMHGCCTVAELGMMYMLAYVDSVVAQSPASASDFSYKERAM